MFILFWNFFEGLVYFKLVIKCRHFLGISLQNSPFLAHVLDYHQIIKNKSLQPR
jgi:hypothetical protein